MKPEDMTLGELVSEFIGISIDYRFVKKENFKTVTDKMFAIHLELVSRFNHLEIQIGEIKK